jgi:hypothetical protein
MRGGYRQTLHADDPDDEDPQEETWFKAREKTNARTTAGTEFQASAVSQRGVGEAAAEDNEPAGYEGDPTEQEVIDNIRDLPDLHRWGKVFEFSVYIQILTYHNFISPKTITFENGSRDVPCI